MTSKTEHTPTPWSIDDNNIRNSRGELIACAYGMENKQKRIIYTKETFANAAFIVRAVNNHEELVHALKSANGYINDPKANEVFNRIIAKAEGK